MTIKFKFFILFDIFVLNLLILIIKPIYSSDPELGGTVESTTNFTVFNTSEKSSTPSINYQQYSDLEKLRKISRFNEMYNDFPRISYDTIHQILRDEDSDSSYRRDVKQYEQQWQESPITTVDTNDTVVNNGHKISSQKRISNTRFKRNSIADNLDLTAELIGINKWNSNNNNNNNNNSNHKFINNNIINSTKILDLTNSNLTTIFKLDTITNHSINIIEVLNLTNNKLLEFSLKNLTNLTQLKTLDLTQNNLNEFVLNNNQLKSIKVLNLTGNRVKKFSTINQLPMNNKNTQQPINFTLKELSLRNNCIKSINSINLTQLNYLEILDLSCNQIYKLDENFLEQLKNIKYLNLANNRLGGDDFVLTNDSILNHNKNIERSLVLSSNKKFYTIPNDERKIFKEPFYNLLNIDTLILSFNNIRFIDFDTFMALPSLQYLDLSHNMIQGESIKSLQGIPDLVGLSIAYNSDLGDSLQEFVASWSLKELDVSGTGLCRIPAALAQSVRTLKLVDNWLSIISCGDLDSYPLLQYLDLSHSHIDDIEEDALGRLEILETLFLDHNNLKHIPISLPTSLENLFLHQNQITDIQSQIFQGLHNLKTLDLSYNKLLYLPGLPLPKLLTLNLQSSELKRLSQSIVKTSPKLRNLLLDNNPIKCSDLFGIAEWTSSCYGENYENNRNRTRKDIKQYFQKKFNYFPNIKQSEKYKIEYNNYDCFPDTETSTKPAKKIKQIIPKCALTVANLKNKQLRPNETTNNCDEKLDNFKNKLLNLSTNSSNSEIEQEKKKPRNDVDIIQLISTTTTIGPQHYSSAVYDYSTENSQEKNSIVKPYQEKLKLSTVTNFSNIFGNSLKLTSTVNPPIALAFKKDKQFSINTKILPILSLHNSTEIIEQETLIGKSNDIKKNIVENNTENIIKKILLDKKDEIQQQKWNYKIDDNFQKTIINENLTNASEIKKKTNETFSAIKKEKSENILLNITNNINNNKSTQNIFNRKYLHEMTNKIENIVSKNFHKIDESNINKFHEKNNGRHSGILSKDKQYTSPFPIITNPWNHSSLSLLLTNVNNNMENRMSSLYNYNDKEIENSKNNLQQQKLILDEINQSEIKTQKLYKSSQKRVNDKTNIKKSFVELTTAATTFMNRSIVEYKTHSTLPKNTDAMPTITLPSINLKNKLITTNNQADNVIFYNNGQNNVYTISNLDGRANVIVKENQKTSSKLFIDQQLAQQKLYVKNLLKSKISPRQTQKHRQVDQILPILLHENLLHKQQSSTKNLIRNHSIVKDLKETLKSSTEELVVPNNRQIQRNLENLILNTSENIMFHKSIILDKHLQFGINKTFPIIGNNNNNEIKFSKAKIELDHNNLNENPTTNINGSSKMVEIFTELNKRSNINSDISARHKNSNRNVDNSVRLIEIENLMSDQKNELTNDNINNLFKSSQSNNYHHYSNDDIDSKSVKESLKNSFNEFQKDTTELYKLEHQHSGNLNIFPRPQETLLLEATIQDNGSGRKLSSSGKKRFLKTTNIKIEEETLSTLPYRNTNDFESLLKVNKQNVLEPQLHMKNNSVERKLQLTQSKNNNNNSKIVSALEEIQLQRSKTNNNVTRINFLKNNNHEIIENSGRNVDNSEYSSGLSPEQWLEIRLNNQTTNGHPGLFIVIGITFSLIFLLGIIHIYRCHSRPWYYNQHQNLNDANYADKRCCRKYQQYDLNPTKHSKCTCNNVIFQSSSDQQQNCTTKGDEIYCQCNDDDINNYYIEMSDQNLGISLSGQAAPISQYKKNIFPLEILHLPTQSTTISTLSNIIDNVGDDSSLRTSNFDGNSAVGQDWTTSATNQ